MVMPRATRRFPVALLLLLSSSLHAGLAAAQSVLFDFDSAPLHSSLPIDLTVGGITAHLSATGQGYSIQQVGTLGISPVGFSGNEVYPNSVSAADLLVSFSSLLSDFSILFAPEEYACDSSARMRFSGYKNGLLVGTSTATAPNPGTWPTGTLTFSAAQGFDSVVIHYDAAPPTGGDWGPIFMADNMTVTPLVLQNGDANGDAVLSVLDILYLISHLFAGGPAPLGPADVNGDGSVSVADVLYLINHLFAGGPAPV